jgi:hypothetical protein
VRRQEAVEALREREAPEADLDGHFPAAQGGRMGADRGPEPGGAGRSGT